MALSSITKWLKSPSIRLPLAIVLFAAATVCMLWIGIFRWANEEEKEALFQMHRDTENLVIAFREGALGIVTAIDHVMVVVKADYERDPDHLRLPDWIDKLPALLGTTIQVSIIGADGRARLSSADNSVDFSDRADFRYHLSPTALQPYFSAPVRDHVSGKLSIQITRRLEPVDSSFAGVVVVSLDPSYLFRFFDRVQLGGDCWGATALSAPAERTHQERSTTTSPILGFSRRFRWRSRAHSALEAPSTGSTGS